MTYTVADVDRVMDGDWEYQDWTQDDGQLWSLLKYQDINNIPTELGVISLEAEYGGEGKGDEFWVVIKIEGHDGTTRYFRQDGWYQSYSGGELDGETYEVKPTPRTVTFYE